VKSPRAYFFWRVAFAWPKGASRVVTLLAASINHCTTNSMLRTCSAYFYGNVLSSNTPSNTMMFSRNTLLAAAAAFYGASSVSAFAPSTGE